MDDKLIVELIFILSSIITMYLIVRKPFLYIRLGARQIKLDTYILGAILGPILIIIFGLLNYSQILQGLGGDGHDGLNPVGILILFLSMVFMSIYLDTTGFFEYCARLALKVARGDGRRLFFSMYGIVSLLTIFTSNDIIILTFTPFIYYFSKHAGLDPIPFLIAEFFAANTWSMMLFIGNPTNIVLAVAFNLEFAEFFQWMALATLAAGVTNLCLLYVIFKKRIKKVITHTETLSPSDALTDKTGAILGLFLLGGCIVTLSVAPYLKISLWMVSLGFSLMLMVILIVRDFYTRLLKKTMKRNVFSVGVTLKRMPMGIIPFILAMFITVEALRIYGISQDIGLFFNDLIGSSSLYSIFIFGFASAFSANLLNNIPMTVAYVPILHVSEASVLLPGVFAATIGSNLGANLTPIGSLAGIMWMSILRDKQVNVSFKEFVKYGLLITPVTLLVCLGVLALGFMWH